MSKKKRRPKQNSFLRFFSILSRLARSFPYKLKRNTTVVCAVLIALGIILSAVAMPKADTEKKESAEQKTEPTTVAATQPTAAKTAVGHRINGIPIISQDYFKAGCETYACTMMLQGLGYDIDEYNSLSYDYDSKHCIWSFKEQTVRIDKKTHKEIRDVVVGSDRYTGKNVWAPREVDIVDAISVEYLHNELHELLVNSARREKNLKDSIENVEKEKVDQERINKAKENEMKYKDNI